MNFKKFLSNLKFDSKDEKTKKSTVTNIVILGLIGILLIITADFFKNSSNNSITGSITENNVKNTKAENDGTKNEVKPSKDYETNMEEKLKQTLEQIDGVGKVQVMIYFGSGEEQVPATNENKTKSVTDEADNSGGKRTTTQDSDGSTIVTSKDGDKESPFILKEYKPQITGVCVVAEGADNSVIKLNIVNAVVDLFQLTEDKVNVYPMKK
ncbi:stage III sporulation protein AG [Clostridium acetobutylicum]|uniref:Stage III sporulation protein AG, SpoIIIAG n=1 Tax=Clostridium acetobutylicum (strain ATCC 824 / DSM 792 / JCM 1419 / IAM 19013 / LMG 5710 / NBRC 13948 / NRRL B-527 / VKM B-1787 / 2291 / W) TaxID=272562 RepID=Q97HC5_CLOAB|nr:MULTISPECIES: stage III sporulation protein AG [Clostridium]AAK80046.1 Stage III sporulation protein AG, SpoIIIAG [Clostridium acetobutylicum ATCC 824]ADZ21138.1 Stage III sporulation protein AG, SpoIIIAG [Clostridium acetobutylicum EA 2018]AEI33037.1 stage III sporulation protein AG, SpoIIIAG [Clostridium acetobutylicum DSM 1731]AWV79526.1 stage III sporulation protein AG [Clostridium acetobutylicum]KHD38235.1 stage III sporulation protein AG [Clostridium acetobutylicum]